MNWLQRVRVRRGHLKLAARYYEDARRCYSNAANTRAAIITEKLKPTMISLTAYWADEGDRYSELADQYYRLADDVLRLRVEKHGSLHYETDKEWPR